MLTKLRIRNIALVDNTELVLEPGLSVLTGETGAGKSVIVTALALALGERADREFVRHGADVAAVTASFDLSSGLDGSRHGPRSHSDGGQIEVYREISPDGTSKAKINGRQVSLSSLKRVTTPIAEILGQHANQMLMNEDNHLAFLDRFASLEPLREEVAQVFAEWQKVFAELNNIKAKREQLKRDRELLLFQKDEIEKGHPRVGEEEELVNERKILDSARTLMASAEMVRKTLDAEENSVGELLILARKELDRMAAIDSSLQKQMETLADIEFQVEEMRRFMEQYGSTIQDDPQRIEEINLRLDEIYNLKKKYGGSEEAVLKTLTEINEKLKDRPDTDSVIDSLEKENDRLYKKYSEKAVALSEARSGAASRLRKLVISELNELAIDNCNFEFEFLYEDDDAGGILINGRAVRPYVYGLERGRFLFSANPGAPLRSLVKTASGGEISRVLLALKSAERRYSQLSHSLLVFDEVDAGIGGQTATEVGKKLKKLSEDCQVIVITHLHQIARLADHHYVAEKSTDRRRTTISVRMLDKNDIPQELDRMVALPEGV